MDATDEARAYRVELGEAVRALKRARAETRKLDDERRKGLRLYEETRERWATRRVGLSPWVWLMVPICGRLVKYHEALKVQEARDAGREEGRLEVSKCGIPLRIRRIGLTFRDRVGIPRDRKMDDGPTDSYRAYWDFATYCDEAYGSGAGTWCKRGG